MDLQSLADPLAELARTRLGVPYLYPLQRFVVSNTLEGKSQIVVLPTGAGKSLCFQLPCLLLNGPTLVLVPLLSLMADQLRKLRASGVPAAVLKGGLSPAEKAGLFRRVREGEAPIVLATPEACLVASNLEQLRSCRFSHLVIDEAHCVTQWGESFRPAYREVGALARALAIPVRTAFTATASQAVIDRIKELVFDDGEVRVLAAAPDRPNIFYAVRPVLSRNHALEEILLDAPRPVLAFFRTRNEGEVAARTMRRRLSEERVRFYHAGLSREERGEVERWFLASADGVLLATCAYGMGVDKPDIRTVLHAGTPGSVEAYLQETGRAGRDGKPSRAILLVSRQDGAFTPPEGPQRERYQRMLGYAGSRGVCRRQALLALIGAETVACSGCDVCGGTELAAAAGQREILDFVRRSPRRFSVAQAAEILAAAPGPRAARRFHDCITGYGDLADWAKEDVEAAIQELAIRGALTALRRGPWKGTLIPGRPARPPRARSEGRSSRLSSGR
jgi:ATP-dependent DNA helicase RecQ